MDHSDDLYDVLQVHPSADAASIRAAYRRLALTYHPDRNKSPDATVMMQRVNDAYQILGDPVRRAAYDGNRATSGSSRPVGNTPDNRIDPDSRRGQSSRTGTGAASQRHTVHREPNANKREFSIPGWVYVFLAFKLLLVLSIASRECSGTIPPAPAIAPKAADLAKIAVGGLEEPTGQAQDLLPADRLYRQVVDSVRNRTSETSSYHYRPDEVKSLERAHQLDPSHLGAMHILAWVYSTYPEYIDSSVLKERALVYARTVFDQESDDEIYRYEILGAALYANGHFRLGEESFDEAIAKSNSVDEREHYMTAQATIRRLHLEANR